MSELDLVSRAWFLDGLRLRDYSLIDEPKFNIFKTIMVKDVPKAIINKAQSGKTINIRTELGNPREVLKTTSDGGMLFIQYKFRKDALYAEKNGLYIDGIYKKGQINIPIDVTQCKICYVFASHATEACYYKGHILCPKCAGYHYANQCTATGNKLRCVNCNIRGHSSTDRHCPTHKSIVTATRKYLDREKTLKQSESVKTYSKVPNNTNIIKDCDGASQYSSAKSYTDAVINKSAHQTDPLKIKEQRTEKSQLKINKHASSNKINSNTIQENNVEHPLLEQVVAENFATKALNPSTPTTHSKKDLIITTYYGCSVRQSDMDTLKPHSWLTDTIISCWLQYVANKIDNADFLFLDPSVSLLI